MNKLPSLPGMPGMPGAKPNPAQLGGPTIDFGGGGTGGIKAPPAVSGAPVPISNMPMPGLPMGRDAKLQQGFMLGLEGLKNAATKMEPPGGSQQLGGPVIPMQQPMQAVPAIDPSALAGQKQLPYQKYKGKLGY